MNTRDTRSQPRPTPICASFAAILPVLDEPATDTSEAAEASAHLATCAYCQARMNDYYRLDTAMRRYLSPSGTPHPRTEDIMSHLIDDAGSAQSTTEAAQPPRPAPSEPRPGRVRHFASGLGAFAAMLVIVVVAATLFYQHTHTGQGGVTPVPGSQSWLEDISMVSPTEGWAVGYTISPSGDSAQKDPVVLMHYQDGVWTPVETSLHGRFTSISMDSATDGWAVGGSAIIHYDGQSWKQVSLHTSLQMERIQMVSKTEGWIVGSDLTDGILHYNGYAWTAQPLPASLELGGQRTIDLQDLSMVSATEGWASGEVNEILSLNPGQSMQAPAAGVILHYTNGQWKVESTFDQAKVTTISLASATEGWASGMFEKTTTTQANGQTTSSTSISPLLLHYSNGIWTQVSGPSSSVDGFIQVRSFSDTNSWATAGANRDTGMAFLWHYDGIQWLQADTPVLKGNYVIYSITMPSPDEGWAVGAHDLPEDQGIALGNGAYRPTITPVILHYLNGVWSVALS